MNICFASWNVNNRNFTRRHRALLRRIGADVLALQEVSAEFHTALAASGLYDWSVFSLTHRPCREGEGRARRLGCSVSGRRPFTLEASCLVPGLRFRERALLVSLIVRRRPLTACSFHIPPGASWGEIKPRTMRALARRLAAEPGPLLVGIDANSPKTDHPDICLNEWWWVEEPLLLGAAPIHPLKDALRLYLADHPAELARAVSARPNGPLAVSHFRGNRRKMTACRYDFIYVSPGFRVRRIEYRFDRCVRRLSDHAMVVGDFESAPRRR